MAKDRDELEREFLIALDAFYDSWHRKATVLLDKNDDPTEFVQTLMKDYASGSPEIIPGFGLQHPLLCPKCKTYPDNFDWMDYEEEHHTDEGHQEFVKQGGFCECPDHPGWLVTYFLLPVKLEERED